MKLTLAKDKLLHFIVGLLLGEFLFTGGLLLTPVVNFAIANVITMIVLLVKEGYDQIHPESHTAEVMDVVAGLIGLIIVNIQFGIIYWII